MLSLSVMIFWGAVSAAPMSSMPNVNTEMLEAAFWIKKLEAPNKVIMDNNEIEKFNVQIINKLPKIVYDLRAYPQVLSRNELLDLLNKYSFPVRPMYINKNKVEPGYYDELKSSMNYEAILEQNVVEYGFTTKRANLRTFPTADAVFEDADDIEFDQFQETAIDPAQALLILHTSKDGKWLFVQTYNYIGWVAADSIAIGSREEWLTYQSAKKFLVVTGNEIKLGYNEYSQELSELAFSMGVKLPLADPEEVSQLVDNQSIAGNYVVKLPVRTANGGLQIKLALVSAANDVNEGYLPYTRANIIRQAFKMQGQRYGWGGSFNGRDCSAFVKDIYAVFGFNLPRNAGEQKNSAGKTFLADSSAGLDLRNKLLTQVKPGATIHMPGHVMLYLGEDHGCQYVIHNISAQGDQHHKLSNGNLLRLPINQITVTDLSITKTNGKQLMELWSTLKQLEQ